MLKLCVKLKQVLLLSMSCLLNLIAWVAMIAERLLPIAPSNDPIIVVVKVRTVSTQDSGRFVNGILDKIAAF
mgnify:CR=1 FL=1